MLPAVKSVGKAYAARRGRRSGRRGSAGASSAMRLSFIDTARNHGRAGADALARLDNDLPLWAEQHIHARAELDEPDTFTCGYRLARFLAEHDAAGNESGDLLEYHLRALALYRDYVLLVCIRGVGPRGREEVTRPVFHVRNPASD